MEKLKQDLQVFIKELVGKEVELVEVGGHEFDYDTCSIKAKPIINGYCNQIEKTYIPSQQDKAEPEYEAYTVFVYELPEKFKDVKTLREFSELCDKLNLDYDVEHDNMYDNHFVQKLAYVSGNVTKFKEDLFK